MTNDGTTSDSSGNNDTSNSFRVDNRFAVEQQQQQQQQQHVHQQQEQQEEEPPVSDAATNRNRDGNATSTSSGSITIATEAAVAIIDLRLTNTNAGNNKKHRPRNKASVNNNMILNQQLSKMLTSMTKDSLLVCLVSHGRQSMERRFDHLEDH